MSPASLLCAEDDETALHVVPVGDDITPDTASGTCPCGAEQCSRCRAGVRRLGHLPGHCRDQASGDPFGGEDPGYGVSRAR
ncbi:hypothetical protein ABZX39_22375 [Streptomyces collinus]|uniref:hypothetical protein n=1 Tax=Streptomyces collinus TaxID=42684 RepID=UPI0033A723BF